MLLNRMLQTSINGKCVQQSLHHHKVMYTQYVANHKLVFMQEVKFNTLYLSKHDLQVSSDVPIRNFFAPHGLATHRESINYAHLDASNRNEENPVCCCVALLYTSRIFCYLVWR